MDREKDNEGEIEREIDKREGERDHASERGVGDGRDPLTGTALCVALCY